MNAHHHYRHYRSPLKRGVLALVFISSLMAFVSVGGGVAALGFLFGPFFGKIWRIGVEHLEEELRRDKEGH